jgi:hypothetical protein
MSMNIPCRKEEGYCYAYLLGVRSLPLFRSRYTSPCPPTPCDLPMFRFMRTIITLCFTIGKPPQMGWTLPKCGVGLNYCPCPRTIYCQDSGSGSAIPKHLSLRMSPCSLGLYPTLIWMRSCLPYYLRLQLWEFCARNTRDI